MFRFLLLASFGAFFILSSCKEETKLTDSEQIESKVRDYFFLTDSPDGSIEIADTLYVEEMEEMLATFDQNLNLIGQDLDTLSLMIDAAAYKNLGYEKEMESTVLFRKNNYKDSVSQANIKLLELKIQQGELEKRWLSTKQSKRLLLHLRRSIWADIAGFNINVEYQVEEELMQLDLLLDADLIVVD
jgi:hypothetical protein